MERYSEMILSKLVNRVLYRRHGAVFDAARVLHVDTK